MVEKKENVDGFFCFEIPLGTYNEHLYGHSHHIYDKIRFLEAFLPERRLKNHLTVSPKRTLKKVCFHEEKPKNHRTMVHIGRTFVSSIKTIQLNEKEHQKKVKKGQPCRSTRLPWHKTKQKKKDLRKSDVERFSHTQKTQKSFFELEKKTALSHHFSIFSNLLFHGVHIWVIVVVVQKVLGFSRFCSRGKKGREKEKEKMGIGLDLRLKKADRVFNPGVLFLFFLIEERRIVKGQQTGRV